MSLKQRKIYLNRGYNQTTTYAVFELFTYALYLLQSFQFPHHFLHHFYLLPQRRRNGTMDCYWIHHAKALEKWTNSTGQINGGLLVKASQLQKAYRKKEHRWMTVHQSEVRNFVVMTSYEVACYRFPDNRVLENTNSWQPGTGFTWGGTFTIANGCHVRFASLVCPHVRDVITRNLSFCVI